MDEVAASDLDRLDTLLHPRALAEHRLCAVKADLVNKTQETHGFQPNPEKPEETEDNYYRGLIPDGLHHLEKELSDFAKDLAAMDIDQLFMVLTLVRHEFRLAKVKVRLIEKRMQALRPPAHPTWSALTD